MQLRRLEGQVAIVTGAGAGIGRAIAARFIDEGATVLGLDIDKSAIDDAADEYGGAFRAFSGSVAAEHDIERAVAAAIAWGGRLDVLVNNAAIADPKNDPVEKLSLADWQKTLDTNLTGPLLCAKHAIPHLRTRRGTIINITSTRASMSEPNTEAYSTTKGGLVAMTHALANSLGPDIRVNAIAPGWIATDAWKPRGKRAQPQLREIDHAQHPVGGVGRPEDVAGLAAYLASSDAGFITGAVLTVDGGMTRKMIYAE